MKLLFVTATAVMAVFATAPGAVASPSTGVDTNNSESSSSFDEYTQESAFSADESEMMDFLENPNNPNCDGIGPNTCDNRVACVWTCKTRYPSDKDLGCCEYKSDQPTPRPPTRRPTKRPSTTSSGGTSFDDGLRAGRSEADRLWRVAGSTCSAAWGDFQNSVSRRISDKGWNNSGNWRTRAFNQGARAGMNEVVTQKEKECFHDSADECVDLGDEAARIIAYEHCGTIGNLSIGKHWRRECRAAAIDQCRAQVRNEVRNDCGSPNAQDLKILKNKCWTQVRTMIGDRGYFQAY